jgi:hypothetical protein
MNKIHDNNKLTYHDLQFALLRTPRPLLRAMKSAFWHNQIFVGGGFLRSVVAGESINDIDVFVSSKSRAQILARELVIDRQKIPYPGMGEPFTPAQEALIKRCIYETDNALTITCLKPTVQIIYRWVFDSGDAAANSFDFTCCAAMFWYGPVRILNDEGQDSVPHWKSYCDTRFYPDVAAKRLIYRDPIRNEDAGGSMLRVLKYYQKGYRIPLDSLSRVIARLAGGVDLSRCEQRVLGNDGKYTIRVDQAQFAKVICGLLREVDPNVDPNHIAHLPVEQDEIEEEAAND